MAFQLKEDESLSKGIRRLLGKQIDKALGQLTDQPNGGRDKAVHEARKCFKKVRAILRLIRPEIGESTYRQENYTFRDAARPLTEVRDAKILIETLDKLKEHFAGELRGQSFAAVRKELQANQRTIRKRVLDEEEALTTVSAAVRPVKERVEDEADVRNKWPGVGAGLKDVYRSARQAFTEARTTTTVETLHEWRKQSKYLRYQLQILNPLWPERLEELADEADHLGDLLGDDHDLAVLRQMMTDDPKRFGSEDTQETLLALIDRRRAELEHEAFQVGDRFFQDRPRGFARRLKGYWKAWQEERQTAPAEQGA